MIRVLIVDDHPVVRSGLRLLLESSGTITIIGEAGSLEEARAALSREVPDVVLLDIQLGNAENGLTLVPDVKSLCPPPNVLVMSAFLTPALFKAATDAGVSGYVVKETSNFDLVSAVTTVAGGGKVFDPNVYDLEKRLSGNSVDSLTPREGQVLDLVCKGYTNAEIAGELGFSENAVKGFVSSLMRKFGCKNRVQVVLRAREERLC